MTLEDMNSATGSAGSQGGYSHWNGQDGADQSGRGAVHVSRFRARDKGKEMPTNAISGPLFNNSSPSADLQWSLESRLRQNLAGNGCPLYGLTWSQWDMPAGPQICRQRASARRTSANGCSGWPSPLANKLSPQQRSDFTPNLANVAQMAGWPTPIQNDGVNRTQHVERQDGKLSIAVLLTGWATPTVRDHKDGAANLEKNPVNHLLGREVLMTGWPTPTKGNGDGSEMGKNGTFQTLQAVARSTGETSNGSPAPTERRGQLNPEFTRWLMGYPAEWASCAPTGTPSSRS